MNDKRPVTSNADDERLARVLSAAAPRRQPSAEHAAQVEAAVYAAWQGSVQHRSSTRRRIAGAVAASVAVVAGVIAWQSLNAPQPAAALARIDQLSGTAWVAPDGTSEWAALSPGAQLYAGSDVRTDPGGRLSLTLDGASVRVDERTRIAFVADNRLTLDAGGVYVDAGTRSAGTLAVGTAFGDVRHLGTQYEVRTNADRVQVRVREGAIELRDDAAAVNAGAGEQLVRTVAGELHRSAFSPHAEDWRWAEALAESFDIDGRTLGDFLDWVARETGRTLEFDSDAIRREAAAMTLRGSSGKLAPRDALSAVLATTAYEAVIDNGQIKIRRRGQ